LVTDIPASREIVENGENGILISSQDPSDVAKSMIAASENMELRKKAFEANPALARDRFDARKNSAVFLDTYRRLIATKSAGS
jgi:glycosyltransferase involved in cell wall biosynthesis